MEATEYAPPLVEYLRHGVAEALMVVSSEGQIRSANRAAETLLGYEPGQLTNMYFPELWHSQRRLSASSRDAARSQDVELAHRNGEPVAVTLTAVSLEGEPSGAQLVSLMPQSDREHLNETLLHVQRLAGVGTLTASVAHELTSPLSIITAALANMQDELSDGDLSPEQLDRYVMMMEQSVQRAARIVAVLRNYTHNDGELSMAITSAHDIVGDALVMVEQQFRKRAHVEVETRIEDDLDTIVADHNRLTQVLINLLLNARDAMQPEGGTIHVRFWPLPTTTDLALPANGKPRSSNARDYFAFSVSDTGPGIDSAAADRLFEPFFTTKPNGMGTGLGLFISQGIVEQHHGRIWAENNPGGGATFMVVLPKRPSQP